MNPLEPSGAYEWLDAPFFHFIDKLTEMQSYFIGICWLIARVVIILCLGFMFIKHAVTGEGLKDTLLKFLLTFAVYSVLISQYPNIVNGLNSLVYGLSIEGAAKTFDVEGYADKVRNVHVRSLSDSDNSNAFIRASDEEGELDINKLIQSDLFEPKTKFIRPNAMLGLILMTVGEIFDNSNGWGRSLTQTLMDLLCCAAVILCGVFGAVQYFLGALEFTLITAVGVILLPFMLWDGTKFLTEKLVGALVGFFFKMLFLTICILMMFYGFLELTLQPYDGTVSMMVYYIFSALFYMMITQNGPKLAVSLLTGTPQMSAMELAQAGAVYGGAALLGKKAAGAAAGAGARGVLAAAGTAARAKGAAAAAGELGADKKQQKQAYNASVRSSVADGVKARVSNVGRSLIGGGASGGIGGGGGTTRGYNRFSQTERFKQPNEKGQNVTVKEHLQNQAVMGKEDGLNYMVKQEEKGVKTSMPAGQAAENIKERQSAREKEKNKGENNGG
jgi:type IV secretion system protein TrbL